MKQINRQILLLFLFFISGASLAQHGHLFLTHFRPEGHKDGYHCLNMVQGNNRQMYFAGPAGITAFDGVRAKKIKTNGPVYSLVNDKFRNTIYAACRNSFGYIYEDLYGQEVYKSISDPSEKIGHVHQALLVDSIMFFFTDKEIFQINTFSKKLETRLQLPEGQYAGAFKIGTQVFVNSKDNGFYYIVKDRILHSGIRSLQSLDILFSIPYKKKEILIGGSNNKLYRFDGRKMFHFPIQDESKLAHWLFVDGISLSDDKIAIATASAGCLIVNLNNGKTIHTINYYQGLPDDEIFSLGMDREGGLWLAHERGFSRADSRVPFRVFSHYPGLEGNIISVLEADSRIYVATNEGLFFLENHKRSLRKFRKNHLPKLKNDKNNHNHYEDSYKRRRMIFAKKAEQEHIYQTDNFDFEYKRVAGVNGKSRKLFTVNDKKYLATNTGLYRIWGKRSTTILKDLYINNVSYDRNGKIFLGVKDGLYLVSQKRLIWEEGEVRTVLCSKNEIWFESENKVYRGKLNKAQKLDILNTYALPGSNSPDMEIRELSGDIVFFSGIDILKFDRKEDKIVVASEEDIFKSNKYIFSQQEISWIKSDSGWVGIKDAGKSKLYNRYMVLQEDVEGIFVTGGNKLWMLHGNNQLIRIVGDQKKSDDADFNIRICGISIDKEKWCHLEKPVIPHGYNGITFHMSAPHYLSSEQVEVQYKLKGVMEDWSAWSQDKEVEFPYLPSGEHTLYVRGRNSLGQIAETQTINLSIAPPYWRTSWFYFLEMAFFASLILISVSLNRNKKNIFLTKALTFLTLIVLVEFLHEIIKTTWSLEEFESPVIGFVLDVMLALMITPIEKVLELLISKKKRQWILVLLMYRKASLVIANRVQEMWRF